MPFTPTLEFLNQNVPLWFTLLMTFTSPYMWSKYVKQAVKKRFGKSTDGDGGTE